MSNQEPENLYAELVSSAWSEALSEFENQRTRTAEGLRIMFSDLATGVGIISHGSWRYPQRYIGTFIRWAETDIELDSRGEPLPTREQSTPAVDRDISIPAQYWAERAREISRRDLSDLIAPSETDVDHGTAASMTFDLETTKVCWVKVVGLECGEDSDSNSETGMCKKHLEENRAKWKIQKTS